MTIGPADNAVSIDNSVPDNASTDGSVGKDVEMKDLTGR